MTRALLVKQINGHGASFNIKSAWGTDWCRSLQMGVTWLDFKKNCITLHPREFWAEMKESDLLMQCRITALWTGQEKLSNRAAVSISGIIWTTG